MLTDIVDKGRPSPAFHHNDGAGTSVQEVMIPATKAGLVIGKGGETIKQLQVRCTNVVKTEMISYLVGSLLFPILFFTDVYLFYCYPLV